MTSSGQGGQRDRIVRGLRAMGFAACAVTLLGVDAAAPATPGGVSVTIGGVAPRYVSNGAITGTVTIRNTTDGDLHYEVRMTQTGPTPDDRTSQTTIRFWETISGGSWRAPRGEVKAHSESVAPFTVRACEVVSDPCQGAVAANVTIAETKTSLQTATSSYTAYGDPSATFRHLGLSGNTPLFVLTRTTRHIVPVTTMRVSLNDPHALETPTFPAELDASVEILKKWGITGTVEHGVHDDAYVTVVVAPTVESSTLDGALKEIVQRSGHRIIAKREYIAAPDCLSDDLDVSSARAIAAYAGVLPLNNIGLSLWGGSSVSAFGTPPTVATFTYPNSPCNLAPSSSPQAYVVYATSSGVYVGTRAEPLRAAPSMSRALDAESFDIDPASFLAPLGGVEIADDRLEIYAVGIANRRAAHAYGVDGDIAAFMVAAARSRELARALGVAPGPLSLVTTYGQRDFLSPIDDTEVGVAYAIDGSVRLPVMPTPSPTPTPIPTHTPGIPYAIVRPVAAPGPSTPSPDPSRTPELMAITAPLPDMLVAASGDVAVIVAADENAITIAVRTDLSAPDHSAADAQASVKADLRARRDVLDVSSATVPGGVDYHVLAANASVSTFHAVVAAVRRSHASPARVTAAAVPILADCGAASYTALAKSLASAESLAARSAFAQGKTLQRLLVASASPPRADGGSCGSDIAALPFVSSNDPASVPADHPMVRINEAVTLTYRTSFWSAR